MRTEDHSGPAFPCKKYQDSRVDKREFGMTLHDYTDQKPVTLQEKIEEVHKCHLDDWLGFVIMQIQAEVSQLQTANSVLLSHIAGLDKIARMYSPEYETMRKEDGL
jgi:hypothetical protein